MESMTQCWYRNRGFESHSRHAFMSALFFALIPCFVHSSKDLYRLSALHQENVWKRNRNKTLTAVIVSLYLYRARSKITQFFNTNTYTTLTSQVKIY